MGNFQAGNKHSEGQLTQISFPFCFAYMYLCVYAHTHTYICSPSHYLSVQSLSKALLLKSGIDR